MPARKKLEPVRADAVTNLADYKEQAMEGLGGVGEKVPLNDGTWFVIPNPALLDDEQQAALDRVTGGDDLDAVDDEELRTALATVLDEETLDEVWTVLGPLAEVRGRTIGGKPPEPHNVRAAKAVLGDEEYARFVAGGGSGNLFSMTWAKMALKMRAKGPKLPR